MPAILYGAIGLAVGMRISSGKLPPLDETPTNDIDNHAVPRRENQCRSHLWPGISSPDVYTYPAYRRERLFQCES